ncbi:hypothetical protein ACIBO5_51235 [Nonomuraea angiospora]|uniref:hypothetical protein n=1 Tax=Nonomuraea angiospora TaxID=46172 RepID=UPI00378A5C3F
MRITTLRSFSTYSHRHRKSSARAPEARSAPDEETNLPGTDDDRPCSVCGDPLDVCTEQRWLTYERCCTACSTRETHAAAQDQAGQDDSPPSRAELALIRTLSDIDDGHLSLWIKGRFFDPRTPVMRCIPRRSR